ncbi:MAG TPA: cell division protein FtsA [Candidatus Omnitrophota bacterium]|nr:cell division protein FtsA [Candidatus Omnitrophota bacterium]
MLNRLAQDKCFYSLDFGAHKLKVCALLAQENGGSEILGIYEHETHGLKEAFVNDLQELSEGIHHAIEKLVQKTGIKAKALELGVNGDLIFVRPTATTIPLIDRGHKVITKRDIKRVNEHARLLGVKMEEEILHDLAMNYSVDDANTSVNPLGLYGRTLGVKALLIGTNTNILRNITKAVHQAGYDVEGVFFSSFAAASQVLSEAQRLQGCALIDIGSRVTSVLVYKDDALRHVGIIYTGGEHFTKAIADQIHFPFDTAEEIKKSYALAIASAKHYEEEILVKKENMYIPIKREVICLAIQPCVEQLVKAIHQSLENSEMVRHINQGIVLIGGGALLPGLIECIGATTNLNVQLGKIHLAPHKNISNAASFASVIGLAHLGMEKRLSKKLPSNGEANWAKHAMNRMVELYNEYF